MSYNSPPPSASRTPPKVQPCHYKTGKTLGAGSYSVVKECVHIDTGRYYAAKVINKRLMAGREHMVSTGITVPLAMPGIVATALLAFIFAWNEFLFANILTGADTRTAPVGLTEYVTPTSVEWTNIMAAGTLVVLPVWIGALAAQRYLVRGLTMGAVK